MSDELKTKPIPPQPEETSANSARVERFFERLDAEQTKQAFVELDSSLHVCAETVIHTINDAVPLLALMQSLLSQRGKKRKAVLKAAGVPNWTKWASAYAEMLHCSFRTIQEHIRASRATNTNRSSKKLSSKGDKPIRLENRHQAALVNAQLAANDLVAALKSGNNWDASLAAYERVAVSPAKLNGFIETLKPEIDWEELLRGLIATLEQFGEKLPIPVINHKKRIERLLEEGGGAIKVARVPARSSVSAYHVKTKRFEERVSFAVVCRRDKSTHSTYERESEAREMCDSLNTSPVSKLEQTG